MSKLHITKQLEQENKILIAKSKTKAGMQFLNNLVLRAFFNSCCTKYSMSYAVDFQYQ